MSRLRWSLRFRLGWLAMLRFAMSASEAPVTVQQRVVVLLQYSKFTFPWLP